VGYGRKMQKTGKYISVEYALKFVRNSSKAKQSHYRPEQALRFPVG
jgi:hypothetical protein